MRNGLRLIAAVFMTLLPTSFSAAATFNGTTSGIFTNPTPISAKYTGVRTHVFFWGTSALGRLMNYLAFSENNTFVAELNTPFYLGKLTYFNWLSVPGTEAKGIQLNVALTLKTPITATKKFSESITINTTVSGDPYDSPDSIQFPASFPKISFVADGSGYTFEVIGFGMISDAGVVSTISELLVPEGQFRTLELIGRIRPSQIVGLGDSVAAGYGLGPDGNQNSYSMLVMSDWGASRGYSGTNLAISGAVSGNCHAHCEYECLYNFDVNSDACIQDCLNGKTDPFEAPCHSVVEHELGQMADNPPKVITLTVGANDIGFADCMQSWLSGGVIDDSISNRCWPGGPELEGRLAVLKSNLGIIFQTLKDSEIFVTTYYNPFPPDTSKLCKPFYMPIAANVIYHNNWKIGKLDDIKQMAVQIQQSTFSFANSVLIGLNQAITETAAQYPNVHVVSLDFSGHDFCRSASSSWVYGTAIDAWFTYVHQIGLITIPQVIEYHNDLPSSCAYPTALEGNSIIDADLSVMGLQYLTNCMPHPTKNGQKAIAKAFIKEMKAAKIN